MKDEKMFITAKMIESNADYELLKSSGYLTRYDIIATLKYHNLYFGVPWRLIQVKGIPGTDDFLVTIMSKTLSTILPAISFANHTGTLDIKRLDEKSYDIIRMLIDTTSSVNEKKFFDTCTVKARYFLHPDIKTSDHDFSNDGMTKVEIVPQLTFHFLDAYHNLNLFNDIEEE